MTVRVLYIEEQTGVPSEHLLPLLAEEAEIYLVTGDTPRIPKASYARVMLASPPRFDLQRSWTLSRLASEILRHERIHVIHSHFAIDWLLPTRVPVVAHNGGSWYAGWRIAARRWPLWKRPRLLLGFLHYVVPEYISLHRARRIIAVSESLRSELIQLYGLPPDRVTIAPNAVAPSLRAWAEPKRVGDAPHLVYVGRLHWMKGIVDFVRGFVTSCELNLPFTIIGDGPERPIIERLTCRDSRVRLLGRLSREEVYRQLARTNIFVFPSLYEGFPLSLSEAMATGHACVIRNTPALVESLGDRNGLVCESAPGMVRAVEELVRDAPRRFDLQMRAVRRSAASSWEDAAKCILGIWWQVAQEGAR